MVKELKVTITVKSTKHPNPKAAIDLVAGIVTKYLIEKDREKVS